MSKFVSFVLIFLCFFGVAESLAKCPADKTKAENEIYWVSKSYKLVPLTPLDSFRYKIEKSNLGRQRTISFVGHMKSFKHDVPVVIKIVTWSTKVSKNTKTISLYRPEGLGHKRKFWRPKFELWRYQKHHRTSAREHVPELRKKFHFKYRDKNGQYRQTDEGATRRGAFSFAEDDIPNTHIGVFASLRKLLLSPLQASNQSNEKYTYIKATVRNLKQSPCFRFSIKLPPKTEKLVVRVKPIDPVDRKGDRFGRDTWHFGVENGR